jgi:hypothetical protein
MQGAHLKNVKKKLGAKAAETGKAGKTYFVFCRIVA